MGFFRVLKTVRNEAGSESCSSPRWQREAKPERSRGCVSMPLIDGALTAVRRQRDSYLFGIFLEDGDYDKIAFHLTNGFLMDYPPGKQESG